MSAAVRCECGEVTGVACEWRGPRAETLWVEYVAPQHQAEAARVPYIGQAVYRQRMRCERGCALALIASEPNHYEEVR